MTSAELAALAEIRGFAGANRVTFVGHAHNRLRQRGAWPADGMYALANATACVDQRTDAKRSGDWKVTGPDLDGDELMCAVLIEGGVIVVTVF